MNSTQLINRLSALLYLIVLLTVIPFFVFAMVWGLVSTFDYGEIWGGLQSLWLAAYSWANEQAIFLQVAIGIGLIIFVLPAALSLLVWGGIFLFGGASVGIVAYFLALKTQMQFLLGRSLDG